MTVLPAATPRELLFLAMPHFRWALPSATDYERSPQPPAFE